MKELGRCVILGYLIMVALTNKDCSHQGTAIPFLKWAGGKRQLLPALLKRIPQRIKGTYYEPFIGGGALLFALISQGRVERARISDINPALVETYLTVRDQVEEVIAALGEHRNEADYYYRVRSADPKQWGPIERVARFIYLNRCGYNGLYRVNSSGQFNVPFGKYVNPNICNAAALRAASKALQGVEIVTEDFLAALSRTINEDFVYCDPPYIPLSATSSFTAYAQSGFSVTDQVRLRDAALGLKKNGIPVLLSNSSAQLAKDLYSHGFEVEEVFARRSVNCQPAKRGEVPELVIW